MWQTTISYNCHHMARHHLLSPTNASCDSPKSPKNQLHTSRPLKRYLITLSWIILKGKGDKPTGGWAPPIAAVAFCLGVGGLFVQNCLPVPPPPNNTINGLIKNTNKKFKTKGVAPCFAGSLAGGVGVTIGCGPAACGACATT